ncbi:hypothetical protein G6321_00036060 [Bradyrhizobium barranii subsp. barranii]|uniref:Uncharacterized protein n=1 Tax=Bradyrhizobium barranii subsp. barranii TaxID=2823807 RepID=A0A7Z0QFD1_9BRAD|nr:hypothetical protein [Bradyrhizobium barranii]UGX91182.1 hypothetical protein G6321_00036060 [Bradyrhizobium barranii subsp. barranii]
MAYVIAILPAWLLAAVDWWQSRLLATTIAGAALSCAAALCIGFPFIDPFAVMMAGLVAALPAEVFFWLSNMNEVRMSAYPERQPGMFPETARMFSKKSPQRVKTGNTPIEQRISPWTQKLTLLLMGTRPSTTLADC